MQFRLPVYGKPECIRQPICAHADDGCTASLSAQCIKKKLLHIRTTASPIFCNRIFFYFIPTVTISKPLTQGFHTSRLHLQFRNEPLPPEYWRSTGFQKASFLMRRTVGSPEQLTKTCHPVSAFCFLLKVGEHHALSPSQVSQDFSVGRVPV